MLLPPWSGLSMFFCANCSTKTSRVHVFGPQWELQANGYQAVKFKVPLARLVLG